MTWKLALGIDIFLWAFWQGKCPRSQETVLVWANISLYLNPGKVKNVFIHVCTWIRYKHERKGNTKINKTKITKVKNTTLLDHYLPMMSMK